MRFLALILVFLLIAPRIASSATPISGLTITKARQILIKSGWKPRLTYLLWGEHNYEPENQWGDAGILYQAGFVEVEMCSSTGRNFCFFNYEHKGKCLRLITQGEFSIGKYEPTVIKESSECPPNEASKAPKHATP
jgi:hypothetical protein